MISLDKKILDPSSAVAKRMRQYGAERNLEILIPERTEKSVPLGPTVKAQSTGGSKRQQFFRLLSLGKKVIEKWKQMGLNRWEITTQDPFFTGLAGLKLKRRHGGELEVQIHGDFFGSAYYRTSSLSNKIRYALGRYIVRRADRVRAVGGRIKESLIQLGVPERNILVRPIAVDTGAIRTYQPKFDVHERYPGYEKIFVYLGRLDPVKNLPWLIETFAEVVKQKPKYLLLIVGEGREKENLKSKISATGGNLKLENNVRIEEWTTDPWSYLKTADGLLFPSLSEGYGLVVLEALAANCPVIMNDVGVARYEVYNDERLRIIPVSDRKGWVQAILAPAHSYAR